MRWLVFWVLVIFKVNCFSYDLGYLRGLLLESSESKSKAELLSKKTKEVKVSDAPILVGFKAMAHFVMCNHVVSPYAKVSYFMEGKKLLEDAVKREATNIELRYFRFTVQTNAPSFLGYSSNILEDKQCLISYLKINSASDSKDVDLFQRVRKYLLDCKLCTPSEKYLIQNY